MARFHTTKPANAAWALFSQIISKILAFPCLAGVPLTGLGGLSALCVLHAATESCCPPITVVAELVRSIHVCW